MGKKFVGLDGLKHFWTIAKSWIAGRITGEVTARIAEVVADAPEDLDTLKEIADWISTHADSASEMNTQIQTNKDNIAANTSDISALQTSVAGKAAASHTHTKSEITDFPTSLKNPNALTVNGKTYDGSSAVNAGVQTVANGGTGATDAAGGFNTLADGVRDSGTPEDNEKMLLKPSGTWYKTTCLDFWNYIKGKISSVLGLTKDNYGGKASTAETADKLISYVLTGYAGAGWVKLGTLTSGYDGSNIEISVYSGDGFNGSSSQNSRFKIMIKDAFQPTQSATSSFGVTVEKTEASYMVKVKVLASAHNICDVWVYMPWTYWPGNYSVNGYYSKWVHSGTKQTEEPTSGTAQSLQYRTLINSEDTQTITGAKTFSDTVKASGKLVIPIGAPSSLEDGCIWIER